MIKNQKIAIITDAAAGIHKLNLWDRGIFFLPIHIMLDEEQFKDGVNINTVDFYNKMKLTKKYSTSQPAPQEIIDIFEAALSENDFAIYLPISDGVSGTGNTARAIARNKYPNRVFIPKSTRIMNALSHEVLYAKSLVDKSLDIKTVLKTLDKREKNNFGILVPNNLTYLKRGGRITPLAASLGNILKIVPLIKWENGILDKAGKTRTQRKAISKAINLVLNYTKNNIKKPFYVINHSNNLELATEVFKKLSENIDHGDIVINDMAPCIGVHVGPDAFGVSVFEK